ncbi:transposase domain-containing protein [Nocardia wallacei]|uniref:transposase domain-containing protein n=1 Tax=Nocardia wallacei TaxID=480035 RepID=UPI003CC7C6B5
MPWPGQVKLEADERLPDRIAIGLLARTFPPDLADRVVDECGRSGQRIRLLPPQVVVYFVLAMCLFSGQGYEEVARLLTQGLAWAKRWSGGVAGADHGGYLAGAGEVGAGAVEGAVHRGRAADGDGVDRW